MKWIKNNWIIIALAILVFILFGHKICNDRDYERNIAALDDDITELNVENVELENVVFEAVRNAKATEKIVAEKEVIISESKLLIKQLRKKRAAVVDVVMVLPESELVSRAREILDCAEVELTEYGILFSVECTRLSLVMIEQFSIIREELDESAFALSQSYEALQFQKMATWNVYRVAWAQGSQILNYQTIIKKKDIKFDLCEKQRKSSWLDGLWKGFLIGVSITIVFNLLRGR